ncbi:hypothetical protein FRC03_000287 [Tulasnella sp. 419]|nr:hypothetical protein FRC03_000287 [Tulasnella sp. 419]
MPPKKQGGGASSKGKGGSRGHGRLRGQQIDEQPPSQPTANPSPPPLPPNPRPNTRPQSAPTTQQPQTPPNQPVNPPPRTPSPPSNPLSPEGKQELPPPNRHRRRTQNNTRGTGHTQARNRQPDDQEADTNEELVPPLFSSAGNGERDDGRDQSPSQLTNNVDYLQCLQRPGETQTVQDAR